MNVLKKLRKCISPKEKMYLQTLWLNLQRVLQGRKIIKGFKSHMALGEHTLHSFFGYYDITPFNNVGEVLFLNLDKSLRKAEVMLFNRNDSLIRTLATTNSWNWQQGARLRWFPGSNDSILFNDFIEGEYLCRELNIRTKEEKTYIKPLYDVNKDGLLGLSLDFERLGVKRPGYGYTCKPYKEPSDLSGEGIDLVDLKTNTAQRIITYTDIAGAIGVEDDSFSNNYINHLSFSPSGDKFMFFWLTIVKHYHKAYMLVYDMKDKTLIPLETEEKVSHYLWLDEEHLLCTVYDLNDNCRYVIYGLDGSKKHVFKSIDFDGHPIWYKDGLILTDSYPDKKGFQRLVVCNLQNDETKVIAEIFHEPAISIERRTDLHPRYDSKTDTICIDANMTGKRKLLLLKTENDERTR